MKTLSRILVSNAMVTEQSSAPRSERFPAQFMDSLVAFQGRQRNLNTKLPDFRLPMTRDRQDATPGRSNPSMAQRDPRASVGLDLIIGTVQVAKKNARRVLRKGFANV